MSLFTPRRTTGLLYLGLALTGAVTYLLIASQLFVPDDAEATRAGLVANEGLARVGVALELGAVLFQSLVALWFLRLFRPIHAPAATAIAAFGLINAVALLVATMFWGVAIEVAGASSPSADATSQLLFEMHNAAWGAGNLFFGLWLIPMGIATLAAGWVRLLGWALIVGGIAYTLSAFVLVLTPSLTLVADGLSLFATIGEFWMLGYLLFTRGSAVGPVAEVDRQ